MPKQADKAEKAETSKATKAKPDPQRPCGPDDHPCGLEKVAKKLEPYSKHYERWRGKALSNEEYSRLRGCFEPCDLVHPDGQHFPPTDGVPVLMVTYLGEWGVTHRRHDGSREMPSYIFASNAQPVRITDPYDKFAYINRHLKNPEVWAVAFEGGRK